LDLPREIDGFLVDDRARSLEIDGRAYLFVRKDVDGATKGASAVYESPDGGATWTRLPWRLHPTRRVTFWGLTGDWPPDLLVTLSERAGALVLGWEDPWVPWEPGAEWEATWDPERCWWVPRWVRSEWGTFFEVHLQAVVAVAIPVLVLGVFLLGWALYAWLG
jgi:hypothetical protein